MDNMEDYFWLVKTSKGNFFTTVMGDWTEEEAAKKLQQVFASIKLTIIAMIPRKRVTGPEDARCTIYQQDKPDSLLGYSFMAGKKLWEACGRGIDYEVEMIRMKKDEE